MAPATISAERFSELVGLIYDCAVDPALWPIAMEAIRIELGFHNATLDLIALPSGRALSNIACNVPVEFLPLMQGAGPDVIEQWGGPERAATLPLDRPAIMSQANPAFDFETTTNRYFLAFAKPQEIIDVMAIGLARDDRAIGTIAFGRHRSAGPIGEREIAIGRLLVPHLQRAATINRMLEGAALAAMGFAATVDRLAVPVLLVDADRQILHANPSATRLLHEADLIRVVGKALEAGTVGASSALASAVTQAAHDESAIARRGLGIPIATADGKTAALHVLPLNGSRSAIHSGAIAVVFVAQADTPFIAPTEIVAALFDLTPMEARVFEHLVSGFTQDTTATALGVARSTIKTHLARLYEKIGVRRQAELVRVAASLAIPITR